MPGAPGLAAGEQDAALAGLRERGHYRFSGLLPEAACERLLQFALDEPCLVRPMDDEADGGATLARYDRAAPRAVRYDLPTQALLRHPDVQAIAADLSLAALAQAYLGAVPRLDVVSMWWHTAAREGPDSRAAQFFHFDLDRPKWVKLFVFLTDVGPRSGPHVFIEGSHRTGAIPRSLLDRGQTRYDDDEVRAICTPAQWLEFAVPRGTVLMEDTRGLHKGRHVEAGDRLVLQLQYSNALFGMDYPRARFESIGPALAASVARCPDVYGAYL
jgi:hypothetical protein